MPKDPMHALRKARGIDNPGSSPSSTWPLSPNSLYSRAHRSTEARETGGPSASERIFQGRTPRRTDIELPNPDRKPVTRSPVHRTAKGRR